MNAKAARAAPIDAPRRTFDEMVRYGRVVSVYDGDTITVATKLHSGEPWASYRVRVAGVDTPELRGAHRDSGLAVRDAVRALLPQGCTVRCTFGAEDKYGRLLAEVQRVTRPRSLLHSERCAETLSTTLLKRKLAVPYDGGTKPEWTRAELDNAVANARSLMWMVQNGWYHH